MKKNFEKEYHQNEKQHFWFKARRHYILNLLSHYPKDISIIDIGCSSGILLTEISEAGFNTDNLFGIDISTKAINNCKKNGIKNSFVMDAENIAMDKQFDIVIASDCLEHIKNDEIALKNWSKLLKPNGIIFVFVPAYNILWSKHDVVNMHYRRYTKKGLISKLNKESFEVIKSGYWNFILFLPILLIRLTKNAIHLKNKNTNGDLKKPILINGLLFNLLKMENKILKHINIPFGISTYCIAKKK